MVLRLIAADVIYLDAVFAIIQKLAELFKHALKLIAWPFAKLLRLGRTSTRMLTALAFPAVAVGVKRISGTSSNGGFS